MKVYLVGGAVRDGLLGLTPAERDWVVVGTTPEAMTQQGYKPVGRDFPVFLHPISNEEYALARLERKVAPGYRGFTTEFSPAVTLDEDLQRRDLTINAIARSDAGTLIDPTGGQSDLLARRLRHVSPAFVEDPVRLLRLARFAARFADLGFTVAPETMALMQQMVADGEVGALVAERVWRELERALITTQPRRFFELLKDTGALPVVMAELASFLHAPGPGAIALQALQHAAASNASAPVRWATLLAGMEENEIVTLCERLRAPREFTDLARLATRLGAHLHGSGRDLAAAMANADAVVRLLELADAWRRPERFAQWLQVMTARATAAGVPSTPVAAMCRRLSLALQLTSGVRLPGSELAELQGPAIAVQLRLRRVTALRQNLSP
jgi:tRNA nucleotidyltransferase (CCA-adding enzyme)